jgi:hypothetical protein
VAGLAFLDAHLKGSEAAREFLAPGAFGPKVRLERK